MHKYQPAWVFLFFIWKSFSLLLTTAAWCFHGFSSIIDIHVGRWFRRRSGWHTRLDFRGHCHKCLFNVRWILCWCFQELNIQRVSIFLERNNVSSLPRSFAILLLPCQLRRLSSLSDHICFPPRVYSHFHLRNDRFLEATVSHYWMIPTSKDEIECSTHAYTRMNHTWSVTS